MAGVWTRLAVNRDVWTYLEARKLDVYDRQGTSLGQIADSDDRLPARPSAWTTCAAWPCCGAEPGSPRAAAKARPTQVREKRPATHCLPHIRWSARRAATGASRNCHRWHRIELSLGQLPAGTRIRVLTHASTPPARQRARRPARRAVGHPLREHGAMQPPNPGAPFNSNCPSRATRRVLSARTPLGATRRPSLTPSSYPAYLRYLPAVYSAAGWSRALPTRFSKPNGMNCSETSPPAHASSTPPQWHGAAPTWPTGWPCSSKEPGRPTETGVLRGRPAQRRRRTPSPACSRSVAYLENLTGLADAIAASR